MMTNLKAKIWCVERYIAVTEDPRYTEMIVQKAGWRPYIKVKKED